MTSVLVADDHSVVREGVIRLLEAEDVRVCGEACDGQEVLDQVERHNPEIVVMDISMPVLGGLETLERLRAKHPSVRVILLSAHADPPFVESAVSLGADAYVLKDGRAGEVITALRAVTGGGSYFSPPVAREIVDQLRRPARTSTEPFALLSARERQVLHLIADGYAAKEIAAELKIRPKTVEAHRTSMMRKLEVRKATELVRYAVRHGLVAP